MECNDELKGSGIKNHTLLFRQYYESQRFRFR